MSAPSTPLVAAALAVLFVPSSPAQHCVYQEERGLVAFELESHGPTGDWRLETTVAGYAGTGYLRWDGPDLFDAPGSGVLTYLFEIHDPGTYQLRIRNYHDDPDSTEENDVWVRMDGAAWIKVFSSHVGYWDFPSTFDLGHGNLPAAEYVLGAGLHAIELSGRSHDFHVDRLHLFKWSNPHALDAAAPQSPCVGAEPGRATCFGDGSGSPCPCANESHEPERGCLHGGGTGMTIRGAGTSSIAADDLILHAEHCPPGNTGLFYCGSVALGGGRPFYDGLQCAGGDVRRFGPRFQTGGSVQDGGFVAQDPVGSYFQSGATFLWQYWTRDAAGGGPCGTGANLSPAYAVLMTP